MKLRNVTEIEDFLVAVNKCTGNVWLESPFGDRYNLKSKFSQYVGLAALLGVHGEDLELFCDRDEMGYFFDFFKEHPEVNNH